MLENGWDESHACTVLPWWERPEPVLAISGDTKEEVQIETMIRLSADVADGSWFGVGCGTGYERTK